MSESDFYTALFAAGVALLMVVLWWPDGPESVVLSRMAEGDSTPDIFIGIPDRVVREFLEYDSDEPTDDPEFERFRGEVRESARITLERRRVQAQ